MVTHIDHLAVIRSLFAGELARMRRRSPSEFVGQDVTADLADGELALDSLELLRLASAVNEMFHLHESGAEDELLRKRTLKGWAEIVADSLRTKSEYITFRTSGSTGKPKNCPHRVSDLQQEAIVHAARYADCRRLLSLVPRHHIYGFVWTVLLPHMLGAEVLDVRRWNGSRLQQEIRAGDLLVGTPVIWRHVSEEIATFPSGVMGTTSGAPCPKSLFTRLLRQGLELTEVYGSSETGGIGCRQSPEEAFELLPFWRRGAAATSLVRTRIDELSGAAEIELPDHIEWTEARRFTVHERRDGAVQVGGLNVFPAYVGERLRSHPGVHDCAVRLMRPEEGDRLKAFIVPVRESGVLTSQELAIWMVDKLNTHERPASFTFGPELPRDELGKPADWNCSPE